MHDGLRAELRQAESRHVGPTAAAADAQSIRGAETVGRGSRGYDAGKNVNGRKRHIVVDTTGLLDRSALYGVLAEIDALGLDLVEVRQLTPQHKSPESGDSRSP
jgi:hypothetical protein